MQNQLSAAIPGKTRLDQQQVQNDQGRRRRFSFLGGLLLLACALRPQPVSAADLADFIRWDYDFKSDNTTNMPGMLLVPPTYNAGSGQTYPLVIYLHGSGQRLRADLSNKDGQVTSADINNLVAKAKERGFFLYAPQEPDPNNNWRVEYIEDVMKMVAKMRREYAINPDKIYVTGLSMGCMGTYVALSHFPDVFAGGVPISGVLGTPAIKANLADESIWIYHGRADTTEPVGGGRTAYNDIRIARGLPTYSAWPSSTDPNFFLNQSDSLPLRYTDYKTGTHSSSTWGTAYGETGLYDWLLSLSRTTNLPPVGETLLFDFGKSRIDNFVADSQGRCWNNSSIHHYRTLETIMPYAMTTAGYRTSAMLRLVSAFGSDNDAGLQTGTPYDTVMSKDSWVTKSGASASANFGQIEISGLQPNAPYQIKIWASNTVADGTYSRVSCYEIAGESITLNVMNNAANQAVFASTEADAEGKIQLKVYAAPGTNTRYGQINVLELVPLEVEEPTPLATPLLHWTLDQTSGTAAIDAQAFQNGSLAGQAVWNTGGYLNGGISLDGSNDWVQAADRPEFGGSAFSVSMWFKPSLLDGNPRALISKRANPTTAKAFALYLHTGNKLYASIGDETAVDTGYVVPAINQWYHVAMVFDGSLAAGRLKVYVNGALQSQSQPVASVIPDTYAMLYLGIFNTSYGYSFQGVIDEAQIYNTALTPENVAVLAE